MEYTKKSIATASNSVHQISQPERPTTKIFLGGLPATSEYESLKKAIEKYAEVLDIEFKTRKNSQKCLGHAVVTLKNNTSEVLKNLSHFIYQERRVKITPFFTGKKLKKFRKRLRKKRLYLKNLPPNANLALLKKFFEENCGKIESFYLRGEPSTTLKIGVVIFLEKGSALMAYQKFRFGEIDFEKILGLNLKKKMSLGFGFKEFKKSKNDNNGSEHTSDDMKRQMLTETEKNVTSVVPGRRGFRYERKQRASYVINVRMGGW